MAAWNEDEFWNAKWSDTCGVCGKPVHFKGDGVEITISKRDFIYEVPMVMTETCSFDCTDKAFELISKDANLLKRHYRPRAQHWRNKLDDEDEKFRCGYCGAEMNYVDRHILVEARGDEGGVYLLATNRYCTYRCYRKAISLGKKYIDAALGTFDGGCIQKAIEKDREKKP